MLNFLLEIDPVAFQLFGFEIRWYAVFILIAAFLALFLINKEAKKGQYELIYESSHCSAVNNTTYKILKELGYSVYLTIEGVFLIRW